MSHLLQDATLLLFLLVLAACSAADQRSVQPTDDATPWRHVVKDDAPSRATGFAAAALELEWVTDLDKPMAMAVRPGDPDGLYFAERHGRIVRIEQEDTQASIVLDIYDQITTEGDGGVLGLAFSEDGDLLFVSSTDPDGNSRLDEYRMRRRKAVPNSRRAVLKVAQPFGDHNGGNVVTGPDGLLYYGLGDGGGPHGDGQDVSTLLGSILRIDPRARTDAAYTIPNDNPFADGRRGRPEIWVFGLRNPWRFSFDRETGDLWIGDVGEHEAEEVNRLPFAKAGGANLGWRVFEGRQRFDVGEAPDAVEPLHEYPHDDRCSVTGGYVYRGRRIPALVGAYVYSDFCDGVVRALVADGHSVIEDRAFDATVPQIVAFGEDAHGELYTLSHAGTVHRIVPAR